MQLVYVRGLVSFLWTLIAVFGPTGLFWAGDPRIAAGALSQTIIALVLAACVGLIGFALAGYSLRVRRFRPQWFLVTNRVFALAWIVFIPIGTIIGLVLFKWSRNQNPAKAAA